MRGTVAIWLVIGSICAAFGIAGGAHYATSAREPDGPRSAREWLAGAVRPPGPLPQGRGAEIFERYRCFVCHSLDGRGARVGPALDGVRDRKTRAEIMTWLEDPQRVKPGTMMPNFGFTPLQTQLLADYLLTQ